MDALAEGSRHLAALDPRTPLLATESDPAGSCPVAWCRVDHEEETIAVDEFGSLFHESDEVARWSQASDDRHLWQAVGNWFAVSLIAFDDGRFDPPVRETRACIGLGYDGPSLSSGQLRDLARFLTRLAGEVDGLAS